MNRTRGNSRASIESQPSYDALSTTMTSREIDCGGWQILTRQPRRKSTEFQLTMMIDKSIRFSEKLGSLFDFVGPYPAGALHQGYVVVDGLVKPLRPVQPIVATLKLGAEELRIVPGIDGQAREEKAIIVEAGAPNDGRNAVLEAMIFQQVDQKAAEAFVLLGKREGIREGFDRSSQLLLNYFLRATEFVVDLFRPHGAKVGMRDGVRAEANARRVQIADFAPAQIIDSIDAYGSVLDTVGGQKNGGGEAALFHDREAIGVEIAVAVIEGDHHGLGDVFAGFQRGVGFGQVQCPVTVVAQPSHLLCKRFGRSVDLVVRMRLAKKILGDAVIHQDRHGRRAAAGENPFDRMGAI